MLHMDNIIIPLRVIATVGRSPAAGHMLGLVLQFLILWRPPSQEPQEVVILTPCAQQDVQPKLKPRLAFRLIQPLSDRVRDLNPNHPD